MSANGWFLFAQQQLPPQQLPPPPMYTDLSVFGMAVVSTLVFGSIGIVLAIVGFKLFDLLTPGKLEEEIVQKQNIAAAILGASIVLGICLIIASVIHG